MSDHDHTQLFDQNKDQYDRIHGLTDRVSKLEALVEAIKTDLIGVTGSNGLRGEFRAYREGSEKREAHILEKLEAMDKSRQEARRWTTTLILGGPAVAVAITNLITHLAG